MRFFSFYKNIALLLSIFLFTNTLYANEDTNEESIIKLYIATFNRAPDKAGLDYWLNEINKNGWSINMVAKSMFVQDETKKFYPDSVSTEAFINAVYQNSLNRDAENDGVTYWKRELEEGRVSKEHFIIAIINGASEDDAKVLNNKTSVGSYFAIDKNKNDIELAKSIMKIITLEGNSILVAKDKIDGVNEAKRVTISYGNEGEIYIKWWKSDENQEEIYLSLNQNIDESSTVISSKTGIGNYKIECKPSKEVENKIEYSCDNDSVMPIYLNQTNYILLKGDSTSVVGSINILQVQNKTK